MKRRLMMGLVFYTLLFSGRMNLAPAADRFEPGLAASEEELEKTERGVDRQNFALIRAALQAYQKDHGGELPDWLSDLVPQYLSDTNCLVSPTEKRTGRVGPYYTPDPKIHSSYVYEFNPNGAGQFIEGDKSVALTMKQWKTRQMEIYGRATPVVRKIWDSSALNLAVSGDIYETGIGWETHTNTLALVKKMQAAGQIKPPPIIKRLPIKVGEASSDRPLEGVELSVEVSTDLGWLPLQLLTTDAQGAAQLEIVREKNFLVTLACRKTGFVPVSSQLRESDASQVLTLPGLHTITMARAVSAGGRVVSRKGDPIPNARVSLEGVAKVLVTNAKGEWRYDELAQGFSPLSARIAHKDYRTADEEIATTNQVTTVLARRLILQGTVVDAQTQAPLSKYELVLGDAYFRGVRWNDAQPTPGSRGQFRLVLASEQPRYVKVVAAGYESANSDWIAETEGEVRLKFALKPAKAVRAQVTLADGQPLDRALVMAVGDSDMPVLAMGQLVQLKANPLAVTDAAGRCTLWPAADARSVIVTHAKGFAEVPIEALTAQGNIVVQPWANVAVTLAYSAGTRFKYPSLFLVTADRVMRRSFHGNYLGKLELDFDSYAREGVGLGASVGFDFNQVPPGQRLVWHAVPSNPGNWNADLPPSFVGSTFQAKAGEASSVNLGGKGKVVLTGRLLPEGDLPWQSLVAFLKIKTPSAVEELAMTFTPDFRYALDDLPENSREIEMAIYQPPVQVAWTKIDLQSLERKEGVIWWAKDIAWNQAKLRPASLGEPAPGFEVKTVAGKTVQLSDFKGKQVVLEFWASWSDPGFNSAPFLKRLIKEQGADKVVILGMNLDDNPAEARRCVAQLGMTWENGLLGDWSQTALPGQFGVTSIPATILIGPDGKILENRFERIQARKF